ncbi:MAG: PACE efflux transporter [Woeseiaceae bacterium]|nr:PACE efflux transporter [Woeseiaceae bacterium]
MATDIVIRTGLDRLRYALLFEGILVALFSAAMVLMFERNLFEMGAFSLTLSLLALVVNFVYNYVYDRIDVRNGRIPTERSRPGRVAHAVGFEFTLVVINLPIIMWWMHWSFWQALTFDVIAMAAVVVYTYYFTLVYDRVFPLAQPAEAQSAPAVAD